MSRENLPTPFLLRDGCGRADDAEEDVVEVFTAALVVNVPKAQLHAGARVDEEVTLRRLFPQRSAQHLVDLVVVHRRAELEVGLQAVGVLQLLGDLLDVIRKDDELTTQRAPRAMPEVPLQADDRIQILDARFTHHRLETRRSLDEHGHDYSSFLSAQKLKPASAEADSLSLGLLTECWNFLVFP